MLLNAAGDADATSRIMMGLFMSAHQAPSDHQPKGTAVMVLRSPTSPLRHFYTAVACAQEEWKAHQTVIRRMNRGN